MSIAEHVRPEAAMPTEQDYLDEYNRQIQTIAAVFFDAIDEPRACEDGPIQVAYFMDQESSGTHAPVKELLLNGLSYLCAHPDSNCEHAGVTDFVDDVRVVLTSAKSKNQLIEQRQGDFASIFWINRPGQALPF